MADEYEKTFMGADGALFVERLENRRIWGMMAAGALGVVFSALTGSLPGVLGALGFATVYCGALAVFFRFVRTVVTREHLHVQIGTFGPKIPISSITRVERAERGTFERSYAGVGKQFVRVEITANGRSRKVLFGTNDADALVLAIERARGNAPPPAQVRVAEVEGEPTEASVDEPAAEERRARS